MDRRKFIQLCSAAGLGFASPIDPSQLARAAEGDALLPPYEGPYFVVFNAAGGWDTTYLMDPKGINEINRLYQAGDILTEGNHKFAPTAEHIEHGMSNEDFFARYGRELLVLNGLDYSVNNHAPCSRYMATGNLDSLNYPTFAALVAACRSREQPLAFLTFGNYSATGNLVPMSRVPYIHSLSRLANADGVNGSTQHKYHEPFAADRIEQMLAERFQSQISRTLLPREQRSRSMLYDAQVNSKALRRVTPFIPKETSKQRLAQQADVVLASFKAGVCVSANLSIGQFDSHANNDPDQMRLIPEYLEGIDYLVTRAEELQIREKLVVIIQSEMGRTPNYNQGNGKDHWSIGSIMFLGTGINGNRVVGATNDEQFLVPIDPKQLTLDAEHGIRIRPEHIHLALRQLAGITDHPFCAQFPLQVPDGELHQFWAGT